MNPEKRRVVLAGFLGVVGVVVLVRGLTAKPVHSRMAAKQVAPSQAKAIPSARAAPRPQTETTADPSAEWGENPFIIERESAALTSTGPKVPVCSGILWDPQVPSAIMDNRLVSVGDHVGQWKVTEIQKDKVIVTDGSDTQTIYVE